MRTYLGVLLLSIVTCSARAEDWAIAVDTQAGRTKVPFPANHHPEADGVVVAQRLRVRHRVVPELDVGSIVPIASGFVFLPARLEHADAFLLGNPQLFAFRRWEPSPHVSAEAGVSIGLPFGAGSGRPAEELHTNRILALASGILGWQHPELFSPRRLGITPSTKVRWQQAPLEAGVELRLPFLIQTEGTDDDQSSLNPVGSTAVLTGHWSVSPWHWLFLTHRGWLAHHAIWNADAEQFDPERTQVIVQTELGFVFGRGALLSINYLLPVGGPLFGELQSGGANLTGTF